MNNAYSITSKHQVTMPSDVREKLGLKGRDKIRYVHENNKITIERVPTLADAQKLAAKLRREGRYTPATDEQIKNARQTFNEQGAKW